MADRRPINPARIRDVYEDRLEGLTGTIELTSDDLSEARATVQRATAVAERLEARLDRLREEKARVEADLARAMEEGVA